LSWLAVIRPQGAVFQQTKMEPSEQTIGGGIAGRLDGSGLGGGTCGVGGNDAIGHVGFLIVIGADGICKPKTDPLG